MDLNDIIYNSTNNINSNPLHNNDEISLTSSILNLNEETITNLLINDSISTGTILK